MSNTQTQNRVIQRPSVGESKDLLKQKILGTIGGGPYELLRAFRRMHRGRGTVRGKTNKYGTTVVLDGSIPSRTDISRVGLCWTEPPVKQVRFTTRVFGLSMMSSRSVEGLQ